jgi:type 1 fimbria pilin
MTKIILTILAAAALALAHDNHEKGKEITVTGLVVDTGCYMAHNS